MLTELIIRDVAIIDRLELRFGSGFNVLTGETGAGKSIIIDAVNLLLGGRASSELIRSGCEEAVVEGVFDLSAHDVLQTMITEAGFDPGQEMVVKRVLSRNGKNRAYVNGSAARLQQLQEFGRELVALYGQHEHLVLQKADHHLEQLDRFAGLQSEEADYRQAYRRLQEVKEALQSLQSEEKSRGERLALLEFQRREIKDAGIVPDEDAELESERLRLLNAEKLLAAAQEGYETLYGSERAIVGALDRVAGGLETLREVDEALGPWSEALRGACYSLEDIAFQLRDYAAKAVFDPERLQGVEERLRLLNGLKRKYGPTLEGVFAHGEACASEIEELSRFETRSERLRKELAERRKLLAEAGTTWTRKRCAAVPGLKRVVEREMADLAMPKACFEIRLTPLPEPGLRGCERGEFYLSVNPGEAPKPLASIASGGELSRIMLAINRAAPERGTALTMIFDEVDAGIGGAAGAAVGEKLRQVSRRNQVLCITHLPQVAAFADHHCKVEKQQDVDRTTVLAHFLSHDKRIAEVARMLGGIRITDRTLENARELILQSTTAKETG